MGEKIIKMYDFKITKFFALILSIQFVVWGAIGLDAIGFKIPILRQFIGFIYLTFVPGILLLSILRLHKLSNIETILYSVGLSLFTLMFIGFFMNMIYPIFGISEPISIMPLIITLSVIVLALCYVSYRRDKDFSIPSFIEVKDILSPPVLFLCMVPFLSILGTYLVNFHHNNILLMFLIILLALITLLIGFDKFIPKKLYPLTVFVIAISLLYHTSLISNYIWGWDINGEYYLANLVMENSLWDPTIPRTVNAMLSIVMLAPIFSNMCAMSLTWVFKIIYPLLFSLVPLGLYRVFQKQTDDKIAFLSCIFFMSVFVFFTEMLQLARQQIAELFLVLLILLMIDKNMNRMKRAGLLIIFSFSLAVSHYGLSYLFMFSLISVYSLFFLNTRRKNQDNRIKSTITCTFVLLCITFTIAWYMYVSSSSTFDTIIRIGDHITSSIFTEFLNPESAQGTKIMISEARSPMRAVTKYLHLITQFFIAIGILTLLVKRREMKFEEEYATFSYVNFAMCFFGIAVPYFASSLNTSRLYQITLIFLAPFCVVGGLVFFRMVKHVVKKSWMDQIVGSSLRILSVFFAVFLLFNSGLVFEFTSDPSSSISLNSTIDFPRFNEQEILAGHWLKDKKDARRDVYSDEYRSLLLLGVLGEMHAFHGYKEIRTWMPNDIYIFLGHENVKNGKMILGTSKYKRESVFLQNLTFYNTLLNMSEIYNNGDAEVYYR